MDQRTFERELARRTGRPSVPRLRTRWAPRDVAEAFPDYLRGRAGARVEHPVAQALLSEQATTRHVIEMLDPQNGVSVTGAPLESYVRGFNSSDFSTIIAEATTGLIKLNYDARPSASRLTRVLPVANFHQEAFPLLETDAAFEVKAEGAELNMDDTVTFTAASALEPAALESRPVILRFSRQALANDSVAGLILQSEAIAGAVRRAEVSALCSVIEDTSNLSDSAAFFNTTDGNLIASGAAPSVTTLNEATNALWDVASVPARYVVCPPELEQTVRVLCASLAVIGEEAPLIPLVLPNLSDDAAWYVFPDPAAAPAIGTMILAGSEDTFAVSPAMRIKDSDDLGVRIMVDFKVVRLGRQAIKNPGA